MTRNEVWTRVGDELRLVVSWHRDVLKPQPKSMGGFIDGLHVRIDAVDPRPSYEVDPVGFVGSLGESSDGVIMRVSMDECAVPSGLTTRYSTARADARPDWAALWKFWAVLAPIFAPLAVFRERREARKLARWPVAIECGPTTLYLNADDPQAVAEWATQDRRSAIVALHEGPPGWFGHRGNWTGRLTEESSGVWSATALQLEIDILSASDVLFLVETTRALIRG